MKLSSIWTPEASKSHYLAFVLDEAARANLMKLITPRYERKICHHVTLRFDLSKGLTDTERDWLKNGVDVFLKGPVDDDKGVQCLRVSVNGKTDRPDGSFYHITHSLSNDRKPVESNKLKDLDYPVVKGIIQITGGVYLVQK